MSLLTRLLGPCIFGHGDTIRRQSAHGLELACLRCQEGLGLILSAPAIVGPKAVPDAVLGQPVSHAKRVVKDNVSPWKVSNR